MRRRSLQSGDPIGTLAGSALTSIAAGGIILLALVGAASSYSGARHPLLVLASLGLFVLAAVLLHLKVARSHGPLDRATGLQVVACGSAALLMGVAAVGDVQMANTAWAGYPTSILLLALVPYRPTREMVVLSLAVAALAAFAVTVVAPAGIFGLPGYRQIAIVLSIAALPLGGIAFTNHVLGFLEHSRRGLLASAVSDARSQETAITRAVQQTRVSVLNREVVPFFADIAARGHVDRVDRERARDLSESIRSLMVADIDRSWLAQFFAERRAAAAPGSVYRLRDPDAVAHRMSLDQRAAVRALVGSLRLTAGESGVECSIDLAGHGDEVEGMLTARLGLPTRAARTVLAPYLAVVGAAFSDVRFDTRADTLTLRFSI